MTGSEGVSHFLQLPRIIEKSMASHFPAEFTTLTDLPYEIGPIGQAFETESMQPEGEVGLRVRDLFDGILTIGGDEPERHRINFRLVYETAQTEGINYLIITTNKEWHRLLDLIPDACLFRVGEDLAINPLDAEEGDGTEHATNVAQAFAEALKLPKDAQLHLLELLHNLLLNTSEPPDLDKLRGNIHDHIRSVSSYPARAGLEMAFQFLQTIQFGPPSIVFRETNIPFTKLMKGITILEIDLRIQDQIRFLIYCILLKALSNSANQLNSQTMVLVDCADSLISESDRRYRGIESEHFFLDWLNRFRQYGLGFHLSLKLPSRFPKNVLKYFRTIFAHKIQAWDDLKVAVELLQLLPDRLVHSRERKNNYQEEFLKELDHGLIMFKRSDINSAFPIQAPDSPVFRNTHLWTDSELHERLRMKFPEWDAPIIEQRSVLEMNFGEEAPLVQKILSLLTEYPEIGSQGLLSSINSDPSIDLDIPALTFLLNRMVSLDYLIANEWRDGRGHTHLSYELKEKGRTIFNDYIEELRRRGQVPII